MLFKGNREALRILKKSGGTTLVEELFGIARLDADNFTVFADVHLRGSGASKGVQFKYVNDTDGVVISVQAGDNGTRVSCKLQRKGRAFFDYDGFADAIKRSIEKFSTRPERPNVSSLHSEAPPLPIGAEAPTLSIERFAKPDEHAIALVLVELLPHASEKGILPRSVVVETIAKTMSVQSRGTGPFVRAMTTAALGLLRKNEDGSFTLGTVAARRYIAELAVADAIDRYPLSNDAEFPTFVPFEDEKAGERLGGRSLLVLLDEMTNAESDRIRGDISEVETTIGALRLNYDALLQARNELVRRLGTMDHLLRMKASEGRELTTRHAELVATFWAPFLPSAKD